MVSNDYNNGILFTTSFFLLVKLNNHNNLHIQGGLQVDQTKLQGEEVKALMSDVQSYRKYTSAGDLYSASFESVEEYMDLLRVTSECLAPLKSRACFYLAAAVSDFYIPTDKVYICLYMCIY